MDSTWKDILALCADDCDQQNHPIQRLLLSNMVDGIFPVGMSVSKPKTPGGFFLLVFRTRVSISPETLPANLQPDLLEYRNAGFRPLLCYELFPRNCEDKPQHRKARSSASVPPTNVTFPLDPAASVRSTRIAISILTEWYCGYQGLMGPWQQILSQPAIIPITEEATTTHEGGSGAHEGRHTRSTRLMRVLDRVYATARDEGQSDASALAAARRVLHLHTLGDIALENDQWYYTANGRERNLLTLP